MKLTILGCQSPYPGPGGATPGYLLQTDQGNLLIDCGSGVFAQLEKHISFNDIDAVLYSHFHHDHMADHLILQYAVFIARIRGERSGRMKVYAPAKPADMASRLQYSDAFDISAIDQKTKLNICGLDIEFLQTDHAIPCYAMKFSDGQKRFIYGADSGTETDWTPFGSDADLIMMESTYLHKDKPEKPIGHLSSREAGEVAASLRGKHLLLTHLYPKFKPEELKTEAEQYFKGKVDYAEIGAVYHI